MTGRPTYSSVCRYLKLNEESIGYIDNPITDTFVVEHADLSIYDALLPGKEGTDNG